MTYRFALCDIGILTKQDVLDMIKELRQREPTAIRPRQLEP